MRFFASFAFFLGGFCVFFIDHRGMLHEESKERQVALLVSCSFGT